MPTEAEVLEYAEQMLKRYTAGDEGFHWNILNNTTQVRWLALARHELSTRLVPLGTVEEVAQLVEATIDQWAKDHGDSRSRWRTIAEAIVARFGIPAPAMTPEAKAALDAVVEWGKDPIYTKMIRLSDAAEAYLKSLNPALSAASDILRNAGHLVPLGVLAEALKAAKGAGQ